jgi:hypothetical protein
MSPWVWTRKRDPKKRSEKAIRKGYPKRKSKKRSFSRDLEPEIFLEPKVLSVEEGRDTPPAIAGQLWDQPQHAVGEE